MHNLLAQIIKQKRKDIEIAKMSGKDFFREKILHPNNSKIAIIAEIKLASPTAGLLGSLENIAKRSRDYESAGVDVISVITEKNYFKGSIDFIPQVEKHVSIPILQKDFVVDAYQIYEAKIKGADALLLIARIISKDKLRRFVRLSQSLGLEPIVEVGNSADLEKAVASNPSFVAVNARDLTTFTVDVNRACALLQIIPKRFIKLGFSGITSSHEVKKYVNAGVSGILVGTSVMKAKNIEQFIKSLTDI